MNIIINGTLLDKSQIQTLIANNNKIQVIKYAKDKTNLGLKDCKNIVDNLYDNLNFYDGKDHKIGMVYSEILKESEASKPSKGNHIINDNTSKTKTYIIIFLIICLFISGVLYYIK